MWQVIYFDPTLSLSFSTLIYMSSLVRSPANDKMIQDANVLPEPAVGGMETSAGWETEDAKWIEWGGDGH